MSVGGKRLLTGLYAVIVVAADQLYSGEYGQHDLQWRHGAACKAASFFWLLSRLASSFSVTLLSLDR
jgi:hypothetical protein